MKTIRSNRIKVTILVDRNKPVWVTGGDPCYHHNRDCLSLNESSNPIVEMKKERH